MDTVLSKPKSKKPKITDTKRILMLCGALEIAKIRLLELKKYESSDKILKQINDVLKLIY